MENTVIELARDVLGLPNLRAGDPIIGNRDIPDSMSVARLIHRVEEFFGVSFEDDLELDFLADIASLVGAVERKLGV